MMLPPPPAPTTAAATTASTAVPTSPSRLRGFSYLRHLHSHSSPQTRSSSPPPPPPPSDQRPSQNAQRSSSESFIHPPPSASAAGWLPGLSRPAASTSTATARRSLDSSSRARQHRSERGSSTSAATALPPPPPLNMLDGSSSGGVVLDGRDGNAAGAMQAQAQTQMPSIRFIPYQDPRAARPSLVFPAVSRTLPSPDSVIRVGRYSERDNEAETSSVSAAPVGFKSKVVSRKHCQFWCSNSQWYIKDVKSSSGTFLNHIRLSQPGVESRPWPVNDGDVVQLGIDFRGGEEMIFRCVKIRLECNRGWQKGLNNFNKTTHKRLRNLAKGIANKDGDTASTHTSECSICLMSVAPCQALFVAPCSHVWHYKCIRPILNGQTWPTFLCPNCRAVADLEADVDEPYDMDWDEDVQHDSSTNTPAPRANPSDGPSARAMTPSSHSNSSDDPAVFDTTLDADLAAGMNRIGISDSAHSTPHSSSQQLSLSRADNRVPSTSSSAVSPRAIAPLPRLESRVSDDNPPVLPEPITTEPFHLFADAISPEGPMTPRNDAGPFVLNGSAGRAQGRRFTQSLNQAASTGA